MNKKYSVGLILIAFAGIALFNSNVVEEKGIEGSVLSTGVNHQVVLESDGFHPDILTVRKGDSVTFSTTNGKPFWPASNLHPSHRTYAEFDPRKPIKPGDTWSFTFNKVGSWKFHGHLAPYWNGIINVIE